jgi:hypothetical protein
MGLLQRDGATAYAFTRIPTCKRARESRGANAAGWIQRKGESRYVRNVQVAKSRSFGPVNLVSHWAEGEDEPWRLAAYLSPGFTVARFYERRMWIEELFGDWQEGRFHLHQTRLYEPETLSRLMLGLSLVYVWLVALASYVIKRGWRPLVDRTSRRDRSYLAIGVIWQLAFGGSGGVCETESLRGYKYSPTSENCPVASLKA